MTALSPLVLTLLAAIGLIGGIGITAVGPGGVLPTIGLFALTSLSPAAVAGTAIVTHIATGTAGTLAYTGSGQLRDPATRRTALILSATALVGTPVGIAANTHVSTHLFGVLLGGFAVVVAILVWVRTARPSTRAAATADPGRDTATHHTPGDAAHDTAGDNPHPSIALLIPIGLAISVAAGIVGIGGPMLTVPLLVSLRVPVLEALAAAQASSIVIATVGTIGYALHGSIDWPLALLVGVPEVAGVALGWKIANALPARKLAVALVVTLLVLAPYLALHH
ncbi:MAG TPA: sulfite exporter TauE/SafE family protein [Pseudonocardiaceae bacterium]|nr:sulfite exporter TauE/SafE family protein [Pseudonocardiaceae bacterium]